MTRLLLLALVLSPQDPGFAPLFDGQSLTGWIPRGGAKWSVDQGTILGVTGDGRYGWLCSAKTYGDFILELEAKHEEKGNSGVQVRSRIDDKDLMVGYQFDLDRTRPTSGRLYDEARRNLLQDVPATAEARGAFKADEWNKVRLECVADRLRSWVNDVSIVDYVDSMDLSGILALQVHSGPGTRVRFRNLRIKDQGRRSWTPIFDGRTTAGWRAGKAGWSVEDGVLGYQGTRFGLLMTEGAFRDFTVRLKFKGAKGSGALGFRTGEGGSGLQASIDPRKIGGLYEADGRGWIVEPKPEDVAKWVKADAWNELTVSARGTRITVHVNGWKTAEIPDDQKGRLEGRLALSASDGDLRFKDIELLGDPK